MSHTFSLGPFENEDQLVNTCLDQLRRRGYRVTLPGWNGPESPGIRLKELAQRLGVTVSTVSLALNHRDCPPVNTRRGPTGRLLEIRPNAPFSAWLLRHLSRDPATHTL